MIDRRAASPEVYAAIRSHLQTDGVPREAANHLASEMVAHGDEARTSVDRFQEFYSRYKSNGFDDEAAQALAVEALEGREDEPRATLRYQMTEG